MVPEERKANMDRRTFFTGGVAGVAIGAGALAAMKRVEAKTHGAFSPAIGLSVHSFSPNTREGQDAAWAQMRMAAAFTQNKTTVAMMYMSNAVGAARAGALAEVKVPNPGALARQTGIKAKSLDGLAKALRKRGVRFFVGQGGLNRRGISKKELNPIFELTDMETMAAMILRTQKTLALY